MNVTGDMVAEALDAKASMSQLHCYMYATEKCRCGEEWSDAHWMRFILERAFIARRASEAEESEVQWGVGWRMGDGAVVYGFPMPSRADAEAHALKSNADPDDDGTYFPVYRTFARPAGPWLPVPDTTNNESED